LTRLALLAISLAGLFIFAASSPPAPSVAAGIEVRSAAAQNQFPDGARFSIFLASDRDITLVRLRYRVLPDRAAISTRPQCNTGTLVECTAVIGNSQASYLVPGAELQYSWEVEDAGGQRLETEQQTFTYDDKRFDWDSVSDGNITVHYYFGDDATNQAVLRTSRETIQQFSSLMGTEIDFPLKIWVYQNARDLQDAAGGRPATNGHTLGQVGASDTAIVSRDVDFLNIVRHELTHIVVRSATRTHLTEVPLWINEGLATFAQTRLLPGEDQAFATAVRTNRLLPISSLSTALRGPDFALAYAQSGSIIGYLVQAQGADKFKDFIAAFSNASTSDALQKVYGFDELGLENAWRRALGVPEVSGNQPSGGRELGIPTIVPFGSSSGSSGASSTPSAGGSESGPDASIDDEASSGGSSGMIIALAGVAVVVVLGAGGAFVLRQRSRRSE
jgi:hypothetical protein